jgi:hypothetical protein
MPAGGLHRRRGPLGGLGSARTLLSFLAVAVLPAAFLGVEQRTAQLLIRLGVLRSGPAPGPCRPPQTSPARYLCFPFLGTQFMRSLLGWSTTEAAPAFLPAGLLVAVSASVVGPLVDRVGTPRLIAAVPALMVVGSLLFLRISSRWAVRFSSRW